MRNDPLEEGLRWLAQARADLHWTRLLLREGGWHLACFLSQQVTEKAIKPFLYAQGEEVVLGHSVERLCAIAARYNLEFKEKAQSWSILDTYYIISRPATPTGCQMGFPPMSLRRKPPRAL
jgi:HEPN domain-containing protein